MGRSAAWAAKHVALCVAALLLIVGLHRFQPFAGDGPAPLRDWSFAMQSDPPAPLRPVDLPHRWPVQAQPARAGRYRSEFRLDRVADESWGVYVESLDGDAAVWINQVQITGLATPASRHANRSRFHPLLLVIPATLLRPGANQVEIELLEGAPGSAFLGPVEVGALRLLKPAYDWRWGLKQGFPLVLAIGALVIGCLTLALWNVDRRFSVHFWYGLACLTGASYVICFLVESPPLPARWWDAVSILSLVGFGIVMGVLAYDYIGANNPRFRRTQLAIAGVAVAGFVVATMLSRPFALYGLVIPAALVLDLLGGFGFLLGAALLHRESDSPQRLLSFPMIQSALQLLLVSGHDNLLLLGFSGRRLPPSDGLYFAFPAAMALLTCTFILVRAYMAALQATERMNRELGDLVAAREAEIRESYNELKVAEKAQTLALERERLLADMHDGIGGTLIAALARLDSEGAADTPVGRAIRDALSDLRLILASLAPTEQTPVTALALMRDRLAPICLDSNIELDFDLRSLPDTLILAPTDLLQLTRIAQEACTNSLRHARARHLRVRVKLDDRGEQLELIVDDDGVGFDPARSRSLDHHGLATLRKRASRIGASIEWIALEPGTRVRLVFPLPADAVAAPAS